MTTTALPFRLAGVDHVVIRAQDVPRQVKFYQDVLGRKLTKTDEAFGLWHISAGASMIDILDANSKMGKVRCAQ